MSKEQKEVLKKRFFDTMMEISNQIKKNSENIDFKDVHQLIYLIMQTHTNEARVFIYGAGRSGFVGRCFAQRLCI